MYISNTLAQLPSHVHDKYTTYTSHVNHMYSVHQHVHHMYTTCMTVHAHHIYTLHVQCTPYVHHMYNTFTPLVIFFTQHVNLLYLYTTYSTLIY